jgi:DNA-binding MarR family transcriptional regulator
MIEIKSSSRNRGDIAAAIAGAIMRWQDATQDFDEAVGKRLDLNLAERRCLSFLYAGPQPAGAIAGATALTPAAVTSLIDRLEARDYVARTRSTEDRRKVFVEMTDKARQATGRYYGPLAREGARFLETFSKEELMAVERFLAGAIEMQERRLAEVAAEAAVEA